MAGATVAHDIKSAAGFGDSEVVESKYKPDVGKLQAASTVTSARPKVRDYPEDARQVIGTAIEFYHALLLRENPFPDPNEELDWIRKVFNASCTHNKMLNVELDSGMIKIVSVDLGTVTMTMMLINTFQITARGSHFRGQFKGRAKAIVAPTYGFEEGDGVTTKQANRKLAMELKTNLAFTFHVSHGVNNGYTLYKLIAV